MKKFLLFIIGSMLLGSSCQEIYHPAIDTANGWLVVDGMITDQPGPNTVKLSRAVPYNSNETVVEQGATVYIVDEKNFDYFLTETSPGTYSTDSATFKPLYGKKYTLQIYTRDKRHFTSTPQIIYPSNKLSAINAYFKTNPHEYYIGDQLQVENIKGVEFTATINTLNDNSPFYRFSNTLIIEYRTRTTPDDTSKIWSYCWMRFNPNDQFNLSSKSNSTDQSDQILGFCPLDSLYYGINFSTYTDRQGTHLTYRNLYLFMITFRQYHINTDVYQYYLSINDQLAAKQQILDPLSFQCVGNITCVSNPDEPALGVFEASAVTTYTYYYTYQDLPVNLGDKVDIKQISPMNMDLINSSSCHPLTPPWFWLNID